VTTRREKMWALFILMFMYCELTSFISSSFHLWVKFIILTARGARALFLGWKGGEFDHVSAGPVLRRDAEPV
jgi:hypothetical protein